MACGGLLIRYIPSSRPPNEPVELDEFWPEFCRERSRENRACRKRAVPAAARHWTVKPPLAAPRKHGQSKALHADLHAPFRDPINENADLRPLLGRPMQAL